MSAGLAAAQILPDLAPISTGITFTVGGQERMRIHCLGRVGMGTATPHSKLFVEGMSPARAG